MPNKINKSGILIAGCLILSITYRANNPVVKVAPTFSLNAVPGAAAFKNKSYGICEIIVKISILIIYFSLLFVCENPFAI